MGFFLLYSFIQSLIFCLSLWLIVAQFSKKSTRKNMTENLYKSPYKSSSNTWLFLFYPNVIFFALTELKKKSAYRRIPCYTATPREWSFSFFVNAIFQKNFPFCTKSP